MSSSSAASAPAAAGGARPVSKMNGRARLTRCSITAGEPSTAPPWAPSALDRVAVTIDVLVPGEAEVGDQPASAGAGDAEAVRLVDDQQRVVRRADAGQLQQRSGVARARSRSTRPAPSRAGRRPRRARSRPRRRRCAGPPSPRPGPAGRRRPARRGCGRRRRSGSRGRRARSRRRGWRGSRSTSPARPAGRGTPASAASSSACRSRLPGDQPGRAGAGAPGACRLRPPPRSRRGGGTGRGSRCRPGRRRRRRRPGGAAPRRSPSRSRCSACSREPLLPASCGAHRRAGSPRRSAAMSSSVQTYGGIV